MAASQPTQPEPILMSEAEYLAFEEGNDIKHEYVDGSVYAMTGAAWNHNLINGNTQTALNSQLADQPCAVVSSDMRLKVDSKTVSFRYPDTMVICGEPDFADGRRDTVTNPTTILEVLSASTALTDHNTKLDEYIQIESVQHYVLISQHAAKVEVYTRQSQGEWLYTQVKGLDASIELRAIGCTLSLAKLYEKVRFE
jgi:Uma2 family endonuclease